MNQMGKHIEIFSTLGGMFCTPASELKEKAKTIQGFIFADQKLARIAVILKKDNTYMGSENLVNGGFINIIELLIVQ